MPTKKKETKEKQPVLQEENRIKIRYGETRTLKDLWNWPDNPNKMTQKEAKDLKTSLKKFGVVDPPIIEEGNMIIGGNHRAGAILEILGQPFGSLGLVGFSGGTFWDSHPVPLVLSVLAGGNSGTAIRFPQFGQF